jgi:hypothetical protein
VILELLWDVVFRFVVVRDVHIVSCHSWYISLFSRCCMLESREIGIIEYYHENEVDGNERSRYDA